VRFTLSGEPAGVGYGGHIIPVDAFVLWTQEALRVTRRVNHGIGASRVALIFSRSIRGSDSSMSMRPFSATRVAKKPFGS
jgi:hypothetical protein